MTFGAQMDLRHHETPQHPYWHGLLRLVGWAELIVLAVTAAVLRDVEPAVLALVLGAGLALTRVRKGKAGAIMLVLLFVNIAFWTLAATASNARNGESLTSFLIPGLHAAIAVGGIVGPFSLILRRFRPSGAALVGGSAVASVALVTIVALAANLTGGGTNAVKQPGDILVMARNTAFDPTEIRVEAGRADVLFTNTDLFWHTFTVDELNVDLKVPVRGSRRATFVAKPGSYEFYCKIPGHILAGMKGTLLVEEERPGA